MSFGNTVTEKTVYASRTRQPPRLPGLQSWVFHFLALWSCTNDLTFLSLICKDQRQKYFPVSAKIKMSLKSSVSLFFLSAAKPFPPVWADKFQKYSPQGQNMSYAPLTNICGMVWKIWSFGGHRGSQSLWSTSLLQWYVHGALPGF